MQDIPDLSWEEIRNNTENLRRENETARHPTSVTNDYLVQIQQVNDALEQGARIFLRVAHGCICPGSELLSAGGDRPEDCVLHLKKVQVEFAMTEKERKIRICLCFWDQTHQEENVWGATSKQPPWDRIIKQAQEYQGKRAPEP